MEVWKSGSLGSFHNRQPPTVNQIMMEFKNKTAIVTGAGQGIGFEICRCLARGGAKVILNDIDRKLAEKAAAQINSENESACIAVAGDAGDLATIHKLVDEAVTGSVS
jgi:NAD(P)-dependent dehydrogenase (short-subunit alcohol dehydrogenase family)